MNLMKALSFIISLMISIGTVGQVQYLDSIYKKINVTTHTYSYFENDSLQFDFYKAEDGKRNAPLIIYVHGGGFANGQRDSKGIIYFAKRLASRGYNVAAVSYRLTMKDIGFGCEITSDQKKQAFDNASYDVMMATDFILKNNIIFQINTNKVVLAGSSAGAEAVLNLAYMYNYEEQLKGFRYAGLISMAGAISNLESINAASAIPTQLFHGTGDGIIPYELGPHHYCGKEDSGHLMLYGSAPIANRMKGLGMSYYLYTIHGGTHNWAGSPVNRCFGDIVDFLYNDIVFPKSGRQTERSITDFY